MNDMIRLIKPYIEYADVEQGFKDIFASGMFTKGQNVDAFRAELCSYTGAKHAHLATSATTALSACLKLLDIGPGDEVLVSDFSFPATGNVVEDVGARPVFIDVSLETFNMLTPALIAKITPKTKAVIAVDAFGNPSGMHEIARICKEHNLPFIEDAACAIGSSEHGVPVGNIADMTCFSFHPRKLLTTGEGGAITLNNAKWSAWLDTKLNHGASGMLGFGMDFVEYGYNYRLSEPQALMGRVQLKKIDSIVAERNEVRQQFIERLGDAGFQPQVRTKGVVHNVQSLVFRVPEHVSRDKLILQMKERGIETTIGTYCMSGTTYYRNKYHDVQPNAETLQRTTLTLPCYRGVDVKLVCDTLLQLIKQ